LGSCIIEKVNQTVIISKEQWKIWFFVTNCHLFNL
jgi:hypothetical protein